MFRLEHPYYLIGLIGVVVLYLLLRRYDRHSRRMSSFYRFDEKSARPRAHFRPFLLAALSCLIIALANPQYGFKEERVISEQADVYIALDISRSMNARDLAPTRLARAKKIAEDIINHLRTERIGLILFAGEAYLQMPLTADYRTGLVFVHSATTDQAGTQGTNIGAAIDLAIKREEADTKGHQQVLVIISDGEDHEGLGREAASKAQAMGTTVFTVGVGTEAGGLIPVRTNVGMDYIRDKEGNPQRSILSTEGLSAVAEAGGGTYFDYSAGNAIWQSISDRLDAMERRTYDEVVFTSRASYYQWLLLPAIICLFLPFVIGIRSHKIK